MKRLAALLCLGIGLTSARSFAGSQTFTASGDTFINSLSPDNNNGASPHIFTGRDGRGGAMRGLVKFAMPVALRGKVTVSSVQLTMTTRGVGTGGTTLPTAGTMSLHPVIDAWGEGVGIGNATNLFVIGQACTGSGASWNHPDCTAAAWSALQPVSAAATSPSALDAAVVWSSTPALVASVQSWIDTGMGQGWVITSSTESPTIALIQKFYSREAGVKGPSLLVTYTTCIAAANTGCVTSQAGNVCVDPGGASSTYSCTCGNAAYTAGTVGGNPACVDKNECLTNHCVDNGDVAASCTDHVAPLTGYSCACDTGFSFNGTTCVSACGSGPDPCVRGTCTASGGGWTCNCATGYVSGGGVQPTCSDLNACNAAANADCVVTAAGNACVDEVAPSLTYHCTCGNAAYVGGLGGDGKPACVAVVRDAGADAGAGIDSGAGMDSGAGIDSGPGIDSGAGMDSGPGIDSGTPASDSGTSDDSGAIPSDSGVSDGSSGDGASPSTGNSSSCGCRTAGSSDDGTATWPVFLGLALGVRSRRRSRESRPL